MNAASLEVPSRIELLYTVLQTVAQPLGQGTVGFADANLDVFFETAKSFVQKSDEKSRMMAYL